MSPLWFNGIHDIIVIWFIKFLMTKKKLIIKNRTYLVYWTATFHLKLFSHSKRYSSHRQQARWRYAKSNEFLKYTGCHWCLFCTLGRVTFKLIKQRGKIFWLSMPLKSDNVKWRPLIQTMKNEIIVKQIL